MMSKRVFSKQFAAVGAKVMKVFGDKSYRANGIEKDSKISAKPLFDLENLPNCEVLVS